jgi:hypothetical protein
MLIALAGVGGPGRESFALFAAAALFPQKGKTAGFRI